MGWGRIEGAHNLMSISSQSKLTKFLISIEIRQKDGRVMSCQFQVEREITEIIFPSATSSILMHSKKILLLYVAQGLRYQ